MPPTTSAADTAKVTKKKRRALARAAARAAAGLEQPTVSAEKLEEEMASELWSGETCNVSLAQKVGSTVDIDRSLQACQDVCKTHEAKLAHGNTSRHRKVS